MIIVLIIIMAASIGALFINPVLGLVMLAGAIGLIIEQRQYNRGRRDM